MCLCVSALSLQWELHGRGPSKPAANFGHSPPPAENRQRVHSPSHTHTHIQMSPAKSFFGGGVLKKLFTVQVAESLSVHTESNPFAGLLQQSVLQYTSLDTLRAKILCSKIYQADQISLLQKPPYENLMTLSQTLNRFPKEKNVIECLSNRSLAVFSAAAG